MSAPTREKRCTAPDEETMKGKRIGLTAVVIGALSLGTADAVTSQTRGSAANPPASRSTAAAADSVRIRLISRRAVGSLDEYPALGLTGANKPNGRQYRLRRSVPDKTPEWIPRAEDGLELFVADPVADGWLAFYRGPLGGDGVRNVGYGAVLFAPDGERRWKVDLGEMLSRRDHLEIQDVRYAGGKLYFNEACQSYSREAGGRCSALVRIDPVREAVDWRTPPLVSNGIFLLHGPWVIAGYGFTDEADRLHVIDRETGRILARRLLDSAPDYLEMKDGRLHVATYRSLYVFEVSPGTPRRAN